MPIIISRGRKEKRKKLNWTRGVTMRSKGRRNYNSWQGDQHCSPESKAPGAKQCGHCGPYPFMIFHVQRMKREQLCWRRRKRSPSGGPRAKAKKVSCHTRGREVECDSGPQERWACMAAPIRKRVDSSAVQ
uniref:Uncharacterized protein n=1 Tax=Picea glauca TaxID=3330 RepID=A0A117NFY2_PICGL|nr:hypothetical protein ABT39_MTgene2041 [Picea glauca]